MITISSISSALFPRILCGMRGWPLRGLARQGRRYYRPFGHADIASGEGPATRACVDISTSASSRGLPCEPPETCVLGVVRGHPGRVAPDGPVQDLVAVDLNLNVTGCSRSTPLAIPQAPGSHPMPSLPGKTFLLRLSHLVSEVLAGDVGTPAASAATTGCSPSGSTSLAPTPRPDHRLSPTGQQRWECELH